MKTGVVGLTLEAADIIVSLVPEKRLAKHYFVPLMQKGEVRGPQGVGESYFICKVSAVRYALHKKRSDGGDLIFTGGKITPSVAKEFSGDLDKGLVDEFCHFLQSYEAPIDGGLIRRLDEISKELNAGLCAQV